MGLLHAGYPIQGPTWASEDLVDLAKLSRSGNWGYFHELGHEMQRRPDKAWGWNSSYTFAEDVEVTVNIFANAALERMVPDTIPSGWGYSAHPDAVMARATATVNDPTATHFDAKDPYPFYFQLADGFGWETYRAVLSGYSQDQEEKDQWLLRWSEATGHNMVGYMVNSWGLEVTPAAITAVNALGLPDWMPLLALPTARLSIPCGPKGSTARPFASMARARKSRSGRPHRSRGKLTSHSAPGS